jgi:hypothetical protein
MTKELLGFGGLRIPFCIHNTACPFELSFFPAVRSKMEVSKWGK